jgi:SAM-dependent methyltransferase
MTVDRCRICGAATEPLGSVRGSYSERDFRLRRCVDCRYAYVADPWTDFAAIYDDAYYAGRGADPMVDYAFELEHPEQTIRSYEWAGVTEVVRRLRGGLDAVRWLDFGCGNGALVRHLRESAGVDAEGFEEGSIAASARQLGLPLVDAEQLADRRGAYDVVTAIEVLEHTLDPLVELRRIRELLAPGGLLFLTTGNAAPFGERLTEWSYVVPEIHISFFEPLTLGRAMQTAGFVTAPLPGWDGFDQILKFKVLKNLGARRRSRLADLVPARPLARAADRRVRLSQMPVGWAR